MKTVSDQAPVESSQATSALVTTPQVSGTEPTPVPPPADSVIDIEAEDAHEEDASSRAGPCQEERL
jgi:hypothetical protein